jgi:GT2 family glycosyltransferase
MSSPKISIIIVHYHVKKELLDCLNSIYSSRPKIPFEIIIVDNDEVKTIKYDLKKKFPKVKYFASLNNGFGAGNNFGAKHAKGEYLFFLNPDTLLVGNPIDTLFSFISKERKAGVVAPLLLDEKKGIFPLQGAKDLTPLRAIFSLSFLEKLFPENKIKKDYWQSDWNEKTNKKVTNVPGTAFVIKKILYDEIGGFDEKFFLYFEEFDLCKRIANRGYHNFIIPSAKIIHLWERSTKKRNDINEIFAKSRKYFLKKHYGYLVGSLTDFILGFGKKELVLTIIIALSAFLRFYQLPEKMSFFGDLAWFYISARDLAVLHTIPLVGITTSHIWLHQGPLWTYMLAFTLSIFNFNPVAGAYLTSIIGIITVFIVYKIGKIYFSPKVGLISAFLFATSPLVVIHARMPFITSIIPFLASILLLAVFAWIKGRKNYFFAVFALMLLLYNFELATQSLWVIILFFLIIGYIKKESYLRGLKSVSSLVKLLAIFIAIMFPILIYDISNGFAQTLKFAAWIPYKFLNLFFKFKVNKEDVSILSIFSFLGSFYQRFLFAYSLIVSEIIFLATVINIYVEFIRGKNIWYKSPVFILTAFLAVPVLGLIVTKTASEAYLPIIFPSLIVLTALVVSRLMNVKCLKYPVLVILIAIGTFNSWAVINGSKNFYGTPLGERIAVAKKIIKIADGKKYNIVGIGPGSEFASFTMNYEYLGWWLGNGPSNTPEKLKFIVSEEHEKINVAVKK